MFSYFAIYRPEPETRNGTAAAPANLVAVESRGPLRAVLWNHAARSWTWRPESAAAYLYDDRKQDQVRKVDRDEAERIARQVLGTELPTEPELHQICETGEMDYRARGIYR